MTSKEKPEEIPLVSRCLAVILKEKRSRKTSTDGRKTRTGKELFEDFVKENKTCYWNPHLEESVKSLKFIGCIHNSSILVGGRDIYLDTIRAAWSRRVLRPPCHYSLQNVGEIHSIDMLVLSQTQFTPLPEALCIIISELNQAHILASFDLIMEKLGDTYKGMHQPSEQIVYETLDSLLNERKLYHTGKGYAIVTPETYQVGHMNLGLHDHHLVIGTDSHVLNENGLPTVYIPLIPSTNSNDMCSIACQTENKQSADTSMSSPEKDELSEKGKKLERSKSLRETKKGKDKKEKDSSFTRSGSVRYDTEKAVAVVKDVNLRTSDVNQDKDKGEKSSLLSKIFGRNKSKKIPAAATEETEAEKSDVEYATFSAQFPPPEWGWYESQVQRALHQQRKTVVAKSNTWHHLQPPPHYVDAEVQSDIHDDESDGDPILNYHLPSCPVRRSKTLPEELRNGGLLHGGPHPHTCTPHSSRSSSSHSLDRTSPNPATSTPQSPRKQVLDSNVRDSKHCAKPRKTQQEDVRPKNSFNACSNDNIVNTGGQFFNGDSSLNNNSMPKDKAEKPSHVSRVFKRYKEMKCSSFASNDISIEYCGKLPRKGSSFGASRDSGVNCIGLGNAPGKDSVRENNNNHKFSPDTPLNNQSSECNNSVRAKHKKTPNVCDNLHQETYSGISPFTTRAQVHLIPEQCQEDSGFNSPRMLDLSENITHCIPRPVQCPVPIEEHEEVYQPAYPSSKTPGSGKHEPPSVESIPMTGSDFYPRYANGLVTNKLQESMEMPFTGSNMWSDSSKQTVREVNEAGPAPSSPRRGSSGHRKSRYPRRDLSPYQHSHVKRESHVNTDIITTKTSHHQSKQERDVKNKKGKGSGKSSSSTKPPLCRGSLDSHTANNKYTADLSAYSQTGTIQS